MEITFSIILYTFYLLLLMRLMYKIIKWCLEYFYKLSVINKINGIPIIPFIGNAHQLQRRNGNILFDTSISF